MLCLGLEVFAITISLFIIYRLYIQISSYIYFKRQGIGCPNGCLPLFGHLVEFLKIHLKKPHSKKHPFTTILSKNYKETKSKILQIYLSYFPTLIIRDPDLLTEIFYTKNKMFDKAQFISDLVYPLFGNAIPVQKSTLEWKQKRKVISSAFYKDKLIKMVEIIKHTV